MYKFTILPYTQKVLFISTNFRIFASFELARFKDGYFHSIFMYVIMEDSKEAEVKLANLPDKLQSVKLS